MKKQTKKKINKQDQIIELLKEIRDRLPITNYQIPYNPKGSAFTTGEYQCPNCKGWYMAGSMHQC
jgi:hypothetical protein